MSAGTARIVTRDELGDTADAVAELLVAVDAGYGDEAFWPEVRAGGLPAAHTNLDLPWHRVALAWADGQLVGFAGLNQPRGRDIEIIRIMTRPGYTGRGVAASCITALLEEADDAGLTVWLDVLDDATGAIALYERLGFVRFAGQPGAHSHRPAIQMRRLHPADTDLRARLAFTPFAAAGDEMLQSLIHALDTPAVRRFMIGGPPVLAVPGRLARDGRNEILHTVITLDGVPIGWSGWARFELDPSYVENTTFLAEAAWGLGVNRQVHHLQFQVACAAGWPFIVVMNEHNERSLAAFRGLWPERDEERAWEPGADRYSVILRPQGTPAGYVPWPDAVVTSLAATVAGLGLPTSLVSGAH